MSKPIEILTAEESFALLKYCRECHRTQVGMVKALRNQLLILLMLDSGLRVGEVCQLIGSDLIYQGKSTLSLSVRSEIAKGHKQREVPLSVRLRDCINEYHVVALLDILYLEENYVFCGEWEGTHITPRQIQRIVSLLSKRSIGRRIHPHVLRHTFATRLMRVTGSRVVQQLLGHSNLQTTQRYTHPNSNDLSQAIEKI